MIGIVMDIQKIENYIEGNARKLDQRVYDCFFKGGTTSAVIEELKNYQNEDGGFGHGLEPDVQAKESSTAWTRVGMIQSNGQKLWGSTSMEGISEKYSASPIGGKARSYRRRITSP